MWKSHYFKRDVDFLTAMAMEHVMTVGHLGIILWISGRKEVPVGVIIETLHIVGTSGANLKWSVGSKYTCIGGEKKYVEI